MKPFVLTDEEIKIQEKIIMSKINSTIETFTVRTEEDEDEEVIEYYDPVQKEIDKRNEYNERELMYKEEMYQKGVEEAIRILENRQYKNGQQRKMYYKQLLIEITKIKRKNELLMMRKEDQFSKDMRVYEMNVERRKFIEIQKQIEEIKKEERKREAHEMKLMYRNDIWEQDNRANKRKEEAAKKIDPRKVERLIMYRNRMKEKRKSKRLPQLNIFHGREPLKLKGEKLSDNLKEIAIHYPEVKKFWTNVYHEDPPTRESSVDSFFIIDGSNDNEPVVNSTLSYVYFYIN